MLIDKTLSKEGYAADAKAVGDALVDVKASDVFVKTEDGEKLPAEIEIDLNDDIPALVVAPSIAKVGQTMVVEEVNEIGVPTKWKAVDMAMVSKWRKITAITTTEEVNTVIITEDDEGNAFELEDIVIYAKALANAEGAATGYFRFGIQADAPHRAIWQTTTGLPTSGYRWVQARFTLFGDVWLAQDTLTSVNTSSSYGAGYHNLLSNDKDIITTPAESVVFNFMGNIGVGSEIIVYGRDKV
jgi:hypothetical protein